MATLASDTFTDADNTDPTSRVPDVGPAPTSTSANYFVDTNKLANTADSIPLTPLVYDAGTANVDVSADVTSASTSGVSWSLAVLVFRYVDDNNFFQVQLYSGEVQVYKWVAGSPSLVDSASFSVADNVTYNIQAVVNGNSIEILIDAVSYIVTSDSTFNTATKHGVNIAQFAPPVSGTTVDNFLVAEIPPPAGAAMLMML